MLKHTFCHLPGIAEKTESKLWASGIHSFESYGTKCLSKAMTPKQKALINQLMLSVDNYANRNLHFFANELEARHMWRLFWDFRDNCAFIDIETTWFGSNEITTIVIYDGIKIRHYVNGENLCQFPDDIKSYDLLVSYCGKSFDIPTIERHFNITIPHAHIDLVSPLKSIGLIGGLKGCEKSFGIDRSGLDGVGGSFAVQLWHEHKNNKNPHALETLLTYNVHDTLSLHQLMVHLHNEKLKSTPFGELYALPNPQRPLNPFRSPLKNPT